MCVYFARAASVASWRVVRPQLARVVMCAAPATGPHRGRLYWERASQVERRQLK